MPGQIWRPRHFICGHVPTRVRGGLIWHAFSYRNGTQQPQRFNWAKSNALQTRSRSSIIHYKRQQPKWHYSQRRAMKLIALTPATPSDAVTGA